VTPGYFSEVFVMQHVQVSPLSTTNALSMNQYILCTPPVPGLC
jgi:hypothetical protein